MSFPGGSASKESTAVWETWVLSLGWEDPLEKGKATPVFLPREFHGLYSLWVRKESDMTEQLSLSLFQRRAYVMSRIFRGGKWKKYISGQ